MEQIIYNETKIPKIIESLFYFSWFFLSLSFFYKYTKTLLWISYILITFLSVYLLIKNLNLFKKKVTFPLIILPLWLLILFWFVIISPYKMASLEAFLLNYFFHVFLFFFFIFLSIFISKKNEYKIFLIFFIVVFSAILYYFTFSLYKCSFSFICFLTASWFYIKSSLLKGHVILTPPFAFAFFTSLAIGLENRLKRFLFCGLSFFIVLFMLYLGRRAFILSLFLSFIFSLFLISEKKIKLAFLWIAILLLISISIFLATSYGKEILIKSRDNLNLLLSTKKEDWAQAGSMGMRLYIWPIYLKKSLEEPFSGTGLGRRVQKRVLAETNRKALSLEHAHNLFLNVALQAGWQSALLFLIFYLLTLKRAYQLVKISGERPLYLGLLMFLIAFLIMSLFEGMEEGTRFTPFWIASGMVWGYYVREREKGGLSA